MSAALFRRVRKLRPRFDVRERRLILVGSDETEADAFAREGFTGHEPEVDYIVIKFVEPGQDEDETTRADSEGEGADDPHASDPRVALGS